MSTKCSTNRQLSTQEYEAVVRNAQYWAYKFFGITSANEYDLDDMIQEAFYSVLKGMHTYNPAISKFTTWSSSCIHNYFYDLAEVEREKRIHPVSLWKESYNDERKEYEVVPAEDVEMDQRADSRMMREDIRSAIEEAMHELCEEGQNYLSLAEAGYKVREIAEQYGDTPSNVSIRIFRSKKTLSKNHHLTDLAREYGIAG